jgi:hypothetical protein
VEHVGKMINFMKTVQFFVISGFVQLINMHKTELKDIYKLRTAYEQRQSAPLLVSFLFEFAPHLRQSMPISELEDFIALLDATSVITLPLSIISY